MTWYRLTPSADVLADEKFQDVALEAAGRLQLGRKFNFWNVDDVKSVLGHTTGCRIVAQGNNRWVELTLRRQKEAVEAIARATNSIASPCDEPEVLHDYEHWCHVYVPASASLARTGSNDFHEGENVRFNPSEDTVVVFTVRHYGMVERRRVDDWVGAELNRQPEESKLISRNPSLVRIEVGADDSNTASEEAVAAARALNNGITYYATNTNSPGLGLLIVSILLAVASGIVTYFWHFLWPVLIPALALVGFAGYRRFKVNVSGFKQRPRHRWWFARMRKPTSADMKTVLGGTDAGADATKKIAAYAFQRSSIPMPATALLSVMAPGRAGVQQTATLSETPAELTGLSESQRGPLMGLDGQNRSVYLPKNIMYGGVMLFGQPGSGKSNLMQGIIQWADREHRKGDILVDFESKGAGSIPQLTKLIRQAPVIDLADPNSVGINVLGSGTVAERAERFSSHMKGALGDSQFGYHSKDMLQRAVSVALTALQSDKFTDRCIAQGIDVPNHWIPFTARLLGSQGITDARALGQAAVWACQGTSVPAEIEALHGSVKNGKPQMRDSEVQTRLQAPMNKMMLLAQVPALCNPKRREITWADLIAQAGRANNAKLIINLDTAVNQRDIMPDQTRQLMGALLFRGLQEEIKRSCATWQTDGRHIRLFIDELSDVVGSDTDATGNASIVEWCRERGRSYGVELCLGTQNITQMPERLLASVTGFMTVLSFANLSAVSNERTAQILEISPERLTSLPKYAAVLRTTSPDERKLPTLTVSTQLTRPDA